MRHFAAIFAVALAAALPAAAAPVFVRLGGDRVLLDTPPGFSDTMALASPRLLEFAETLSSASNRILLFALTDADLRRFQNGDAPELRRYVLAASPARLQHERLGASQFEALAAQSRADFGVVPPGGTSDPLKYLDAKPAGQRQLLEMLRDEPFIVSVLQGARLPAQRDAEREKPRYVFSTTTLLLVRGKVLSLSVYANYRDPADLGWLRGITAEWIDDILRINRNR